MADRRLVKYWMPFGDIHDGLDLPNEDYFLKKLVK